MKTKTRQFLESVLSVCLAALQAPGPGLLAAAPGPGSASAPGRFRLVRDEGGTLVCKNPAGEEGYNPMTVEQLKRTRQGECADLRGANLERAYLFEADLRGANLTRAHLEGAYLFKAQMQAVILNEAELDGANLRKADLRESEMFRADLSHATLAGADLRDSGLVWAWSLYGASYDADTRLPFDEKLARERGMIRAE